jgi:hypothetical protein
MCVTAAKIYNVLATTLRRRRNGYVARRDISANSKKLTDLKEQTIIRYIIQLAKRSFPPRLRDMEDIANRLLHMRGDPPIGIRWIYNFIRRQSELHT